MKSFKFERLFLLILLVPTVSSLIISSVYAGKKKFKTYSFGSPLLPAIVKVQPNKLHLTFRQNKYLRAPQFKIEGTLPLKAPTIVRDVWKKDPNPEVVEYNIGDMGDVPEANQHITYDGSRNYPTYAEAPQGFEHSLVPPSMPSHSQPSTSWTPIIQKPIEWRRALQSNSLSTVHRIRRFAKEFNFPFNLNLNPKRFLKFGQNPDIRPNEPNLNPYPYSGHNSQAFNSPQNHNYFDPKQHSFDENSGNIPFISSHQSSHSTHHSYPSYQSTHEVSASPSSYPPPKYERVFAPANHQNNKWIPIERPPVSSVHSVPHNPNAPLYSTNHQNYGKTSDAHKKLNIGEHYNPSASYVDETMVEKPTYDPDEEEPDEGSISFSISGPHGDNVPAGYEAKINQMHEELKDHPQQIPPGLDMAQAMKYYNAHTFTDPLRNHYGYKAAIGPLGFLKSKLKSWKSIF